MRFPSLPIRLLACAVAALVLAPVPGQAWPWNSEPQPLLEGEEPIRADAGSPLSWDQSWRYLWYVRSGQLRHVAWTSQGFKVRSVVDFRPKAEAGLIVDSGWHFLYAVDANGIPHCVRRVNAKHWIAEKIWNGPITKLLGIDPTNHALIAYDAGAQGLRSIGCNAKNKTWRSAIIATGLGPVGDAAAIDPVWKTIYTTHQTVSPDIARHPTAPVSYETTRGIYQPWPLVATSWNGKKWTSQVLADTGVPQQPAVRLADHRVFYAGLYSGTSISVFQPARNTPFGGAFEIRDGWASQDTWEDHDQYNLRKPQYPESWGFEMSFTSLTYLGGLNWYSSYLSYEPVSLPGPITIVPYYKPIWQELPVMSSRIGAFRAVVNPKQGRLVQHREIWNGEVARQQIGKELAGYLYRGANGVLAMRGTAGFNPKAQIGSGYACPKLDSTVDLANVPDYFAQLADPAITFVAYRSETTAADFVLGDPGSFPNQIPPYYSVNADAPFVRPYLQQPTQIVTRTLGHQYTSTRVDQPGGRYRRYRGAGTSLAAETALAVDLATGVTFYTQAATPPTTMEEKWKGTVAQTNPPLAGFLPIPESKLPVPADRSVWIVMVY
jgi:hypothetical protein